MANVLMILSAADHWTLEDGSAHPTGFWAEEFVAPYEVFTDATIRLFEDGIGSYVPKPIRMTDDGLVDRITGGDCAQAHHIRTIESVDLLLASVPAPPQYFADVERIEFPELTIGGFKVDFAAYAQFSGLSIADDSIGCGDDGDAKPSQYLRYLVAFRIDL